MQDPLRCAICGDVIGAYEPLIELVGETARESPRRAVLARAGERPTCYHRSCYEQQEPR